MYTASIEMMSDSSFNIQRNLDSMSKSAPSGDNPESTLEKEQGMVSDNLQNKLVYTASDYMADTEQRVRKENIKRSFDVFS